MKYNEKWTKEQWSIYAESFKDKTRYEISCEIVELYNWAPEYFPNSEEWRENVSNTIKRLNEIWKIKFNEM